jgi:threonine synthase
VVGLIERFRDRLPVSATTPIVSLGEGSTPLLHAPRLGAALGVDLYLKLEGQNPTGSFKDRGMTLALSKALEDGALAVVCASTGNTSASAAAYAARAGLRCSVVVPAGAVALGKLAQAQACGARVVAIDGTFDDALSAVRELADRHPVTLVNNLNPYRLEGQKTAAFEILEELGAPPAVLALPYGGGGNTRAYVMGFEEAGAGLPRVVAVESSLRAETAASAIRISAPVHAPEVEEALERTGGLIAKVSDEALLEAWRALAQEEGIFCEPASAAGVAGLAHAELPSGTRVVCVITGHGLKDPEAVERLTPPPAAVDPDPDAIAAIA